MGRFETRGLADNSDQGSGNGNKSPRFFSEIRLRTPESVELEFPLAGIGSRAYALFVDYLLLALGMIVVVLVGALMAYQIQSYFRFSTDFFSAIGGWIAAIVLFLLFWIFVGYFVIFETLWQGQTPGKKLAQIRVIREDGRPIALPQATLRGLLRVFDDFFLFLVGFILILQGRQEKRLGDWVAGTVVIQELRQKKDRIKIMDEVKAKEVALSLLEISNLGPLSPDDFAIVREYLTRRANFSARAQETVSLRLAQQLKEKLDLDALPFDMTANLFLEGIYLAYGLIKSR
jgi:uncharacterized RDD family membrane protein YckC